MRYTVIFMVMMGVSLVACSHADEKKPTVRTSILYSPNGEPIAGGILGNPSCVDAYSGWFSRLDVNHTGFISHEAFIADAAAQFKRMDIDHNGSIVSEELERYRLPYRPKIEAPEPKDMTAKTTTKHAGMGKPQEDTDENANGGDPVMSADTNLDFRVTSEEFMIHAQKVFSELDTNHDNQLGRDELLSARCKPDK